MPDITDIIGKIPYRMAFAGGWIDQPFISRLNPDPPGSMVVVNIEPTVRFMDRCGMGTSTRNVAARLWGPELPNREPGRLVRELYMAENGGKPEPSGSQDMAGLIYPGVNRLDYNFDVEGGYFPCHVESCNDPEVARWLEGVIWVAPVVQRLPGYSPLGEQHLDASWVRRLGQSGKDCYTAILARDARGLAESMRETMCCWETLLPHVVHHPTIAVDLMALLAHYQARYLGAMYSGCGGGYLYIVSEEPVPGAFQVQVRAADGQRRADERRES